MTHDRRRAAAALSLFALVALAPLGARADDRADASRALHAGLAGDPREAARALALYEKLSAAAPDDPVLLASAGSAQTIVARDTASPLEALQIAEAGLARIDRAMRLLGPAHDAPGTSGTPAALTTYLIAASTFLGVPENPFQRRADGKAVLARALANPALPNLPRLRAQFASLEAAVARAEGRPADELAALKQVAALDPTCPEAAEVQARIQELSR